jgi:hypothetical protein
MDAALPDEPRRAPPSEAEEVEEVDLWWGGYAGRTVVPEFVLAGLLTVALVGLAWYSGAWKGADRLRSLMPILLGGFWLFQVARWLYRVLTANYRLTTRRLLCECGFGHPARPGIELNQVSQIVVERRLFERLAGVGRLRIVVQDGAVPPLILEGVPDPEQVAMLIRRQVQHVRERE